jgi:Na+-transporting NADH:ubiquinone oxidoreductase subunit NqrD
VYEDKVVRFLVQLLKSFLYLLYNSLSSFALLITDHCLSVRELILWLKTNAIA